jgi:hypothetical protein
LFANLEKTNSKLTPLKGEKEADHQKNVKQLTEACDLQEAKKRVLEELNADLIEEHENEKEELVTAMKIAEEAIKKSNEEALGLRSELTKMAAKVERCKKKALKKRLMNETRKKELRGEIKAAEEAIKNSDEEAHRLRSELKKMIAEVERCKKHALEKDALHDYEKKELRGKIKAAKKEATKKSDEEVLRLRSELESDKKQFMSGSENQGGGVMQNEQANGQAAQGVKTGG